ncbi:alkane-1 monooxygenase [Nitritalea halalkaliphila LW7]|uniref:Alkane-1 monooxygenase n=1 Tax=Nitritalea halalkaliphila LW7 TaxID=1189621 RepID=I5BY30_9BACT|nr:alkane 1-monooxygenase [Nitritalea halalkaliphila]EIM74482.1 alkane-1 monooxygenase [Nitritalea halalkaliphila LW7]
MKRNDLAYLAAYSLPLTGFLAAYMQGVYVFSAFLLAFGIIPVLDAVWPRPHVSRAHAAESVSRLHHRYFDLLLYLCPVLSLLLVAYTQWQIRLQEPATWEYIGLILSTGTVLGAIGINVAHELGHRKAPLPRFLAKVGLLPALYQHFYIEHNQGHHRHVSTPLDPATARFGEPLYAFWARSVVGQYASAWQIEKKKLQSRGLPIFSFYNEYLRFMLFQLAYLAVNAYFFGLIGLIFALFSAVVAFLLLETINYIEHYGLERKKNENGRYERVQPHHSWNSHHRIGRAVLFELTLHSDHHHLASKKYQMLEHREVAPQLPYGYPASMLLALLPPLWFKQMNPKVAEWRRKYLYE